MEKKQEVKKLLIVLFIVLVCVFALSLVLLLSSMNKGNSEFVDGETVRYAELEEMPDVQIKTAKEGSEHDGSSAVKVRAKAATDGYTLGLNAIKNALKTHQERVVLSVGQVTDEDFANIVDNLYNTSSGRIFSDTWGFLQFDTCWMVEFDGEQYMTEINLIYFLTEEQIQSAEAEVENLAQKAQTRAKELNQKSGKNITQSEIKYIHNYLVKYTAYATAKSAKWEEISFEEAHSTYGPLLKHRGYCAGYALAFARAAKAAGIQNVGYVVCYAPCGEFHAINRVKLDGTWYYYDCTWDDPLTLDYEDQGSDAEICYDYYKKTKSQMVELGYSFDVQTAA